MKWRVILGILMLAVAVGYPVVNVNNAHATINRQINFQGKLTNPDGTNLTNGSYTIEFNIYTVSSGGSTVWTESKSLTLTDGIFQTNLGDTTSLPGSVDFNNSTLYLGITVNADPEMTPRIRLTAAPYALNSDSLDGLDSAAFGQLTSNQTWTGTNTLQPTTNITSAVIKQTSFGSATADIFNIQTANSTSILQVTGPAVNEAAVTLNSVGATRALTLDSGSGTIILGSNTTTLQKSGTAFTFDVNNAATSTFTVTNAGAGVANVSIEGSVTSVGLNSGTGLIEGTGGLTVTGTTNINATGTSATNVGNSTGALVVASGGTSSWANTSGGLTISTVTSGTLAVTSAGALNTTAAAASTIQTTGTSSTLGIRSGATTADVALLLDTNAVAGGSGGLTAITGNASAGVSGSTNINTGTGTTATGAIVIATGNASAGTAGNIVLDVGTSTSGNGTILVGNTARAQTVTIGNGTSSTSVTVLCGTGACGFGDNAVAHATTIGNAVSTSTNTINGGTGGLNLGDNAITQTIDIGGVTNSGTDTINIATNSTAADTITLGNTNAATKIILASGANTTSSGVAGVIIGSATTDTTQINLQLDTSSTFTETGSTCSTTVNQGAMYYNSTAGALRACVNGNWEDMVSTAGLGLQLFGVVPDSGANPGDLAAVTGVQNGPCKVSLGANAQTVSWTACIAYSGGRKVIVTAGTAGTTNAVGGQFQHLCLTGTNNQPALSTTGAETANLSTVSMPSVTAPILCLADIRFAAANNTITQVYDTRTYTTSEKIPVSVNSATVLSAIVIFTATKGVVVTTTTANTNAIAGVLVATTGAASTTTINGIIATGGPAAVKAVTGTNVVSANIFTSTTAGYASTVATKPAESTSTIYNLLGNARTAWSGASACTNNSDTCAGSILTYIDKR